MSINIDINIKVEGLLAAALKQRAASRNNFLIDSERKKIENSNKPADTAATRQNRYFGRRSENESLSDDARGSQYTPYLEKPSAYINEQFSYGAIAIRVKTLDGSSGEINRNVTVNIGGFDHLEPTTFTYSYPPVRLYSPSVTSGDSHPVTRSGVFGLSYWDSGDCLPPNFYTTIPAWDDQKLSRSSSSVTSGSEEVDKTEYFLVPDGAGGVYVYLHVNDYVHAYTYSSSNSEVVTDYNLIYEQFEGVFLLRNDQGEGIPCDILAWPGVLPGYYDYWFSRQDGPNSPNCPQLPQRPRRLAMVYSKTVTNGSVGGYADRIEERNDVYVFHVSNGRVQDVTPAETENLLAIINAYNKPARPNDTRNSSESSGILELEWSGMTNGGLPTDVVRSPINWYIISYNFSSTSITIPSYNEDKSDTWNGFGRDANLELIRFATEIFEFAEEEAVARVWGPSFGLALKNIKPITEQQSLDLEYLTETFFEGELPRRNLSIAEVALLIPPAWTITGEGEERYTMEYYSNWGNAGLCRYVRNFLS